MQLKLEESDLSQLSTASVKEYVEHCNSSTISDSSSTQDSSSSRFMHWKLGRGLGIHGCRVDFGTSGFGDARFQTGRGELSLSLQGFGMCSGAFDFRVGLRRFRRLRFDSCNISGFGVSSKKDLGYCQARGAE